MPIDEVNEKAGCTLLGDTSLEIFMSGAAPLAAQN